METQIQTCIEFSKCAKENAKKQFNKRYRVCNFNFNQSFSEFIHMHVFWKSTIVYGCLLKKYLCDFMRYVFIKEKRRCRQRENFKVM